MTPMISDAHEKISFRLHTPTLLCILQKVMQVAESFMTCNHYLVVGELERFYCFFATLKNTIVPPQFLDDNFILTLSLSACCVGQLPEYVVIVCAALGNCILTLKIWSCDKQMSAGLLYTNNLHHFFYFYCRLFACITATGSLQVSFAYWLVVVKICQSFCLQQQQQQQQDDFVSEMMMVALLRNFSTRPITGCSRSSKFLNICFTDQFLINNLILGLTFSYIIIISFVSINSPRQCSLVENQPSRKSICLSRPGAVVISYLVQLPRDDRSRRVKRKTSIIPTLQGWSVVVGDVTCPTIAVIDVQR
ncbi:hypothetical protein T06_2338 [Trichinella sp. T6]|nr:hypothetical protein T06_2338 [Trichinella sp. T6]